MFNEIAAQFEHIVPSVDFWSLRLVDRRYEGLCVRQNILQPVQNLRSTGALITLLQGNGYGYAATCDLSPQGLEEASRQALSWIDVYAQYNLLTASQHARPKKSGHYHTTANIQWADWSLQDKITLLHHANNRLKQSEAIVDWSASLGHEVAQVLLVNSHGARIEQSFAYLSQGLGALANQGSETLRRTFGFDQHQQGGMELLEHRHFLDEASRVGDEALQLIHAPNCPAGQLDLLLMPGQMILQIHESIGHPLELDRILGDERNYAGTSFVTLDMFGHYRYGSELLNVTFDPTLEHQFASYGFDAEGTPAQRQYIIRDGILERPLGCTTSQRRTGGLAGVANARSNDWNRPPIDRMANLNLEPGTSSLEDMIAAVENGVLMDTNRSWSIDDSRNKFQFGCEYGRLIKDGELTKLVKNPNYRGISATFWRNLKKVGDHHTFKIMGVPNCGKGEPNQTIHVGHASPACVFSKVDVFGGT